jgi:hypothetical protein
MKGTYLPNARARFDGRRESSGFEICARSTTSTRSFHGVEEEQMLTKPTRSTIGAQCKWRRGDTRMNAERAGLGWAGLLLWRSNTNYHGELCVRKDSASVGTSLNLVQ